MLHLERPATIVTAIDQHLTWLSMDPPASQRPAYYSGFN
jgi:hypothetical protein